MRSGDPVQVLPDLVAATQADGIYAHTDCERIYGRVRDANLNAVLHERGMKIRWFEPPASTDELMRYPAYRRYWYSQMRSSLAPTPSHIDVPTDLGSDTIPHPEILGHHPDSKHLPTGGSAAAQQLLHSFLAGDKPERYYWQLSYPAARATTGLSPYLKFGVISPRECYQTVRSLQQSDCHRQRRSANQLIARLRWGSGFHQRFRYLPQLEIRSLYRVFDTKGWAFDDTLYRAWQQGKTGFPIVDAAARCLLATGGWHEMNFRIRAIYASFLSNLLGMDWRYGALHFMRHLIDGDCPIDHYQWAMQAGVTHCADKSWTRIYNPQQTAVDRCDPDGQFIKRWLPELATLSPAQLGSPPPLDTYPAPILDYRLARRHRVAQLKHQRSHFRQAVDIVPYLTRLPGDLTPFGTKRFDCDISWLEQPTPELFPSALDLDSLDPPAAAAALRTWLVAHVDIQPHRSSTRRRPKRRSPSSPDDGIDQLRLL